MATRVYQTPETYNPALGHLTVERSVEGDYFLKIGALNSQDRLTMASLVLGSIGFFQDGSEVVRVEIRGRYSTVRGIQIDKNPTLSVGADYGIYLPAGQPEIVEASDTMRDPTLLSASSSTAIVDEEKAEIVSYVNGNPLRYNFVLEWFDSVNDYIAGTQMAVSEQPESVSLTPSAPVTTAGRHDVILKFTPQHSGTLIYRLYLQ